MRDDRLRYSDLLAGRRPTTNAAPRKRARASAARFEKGISLDHDGMPGPLAHPAEQKRLFPGQVPRQPSPFLYVDHIDERGVDLFHEVCRQDLEGIVAKRRDGRS